MMASLVDCTTILEGRYPSYTIEVNTFIESADVSSSPEISAQMVYEAIKSDGKVCDNLKLLYHEAIFGSNKKVKKRIYNRMSHFRRTLR